MAHGEAQRPLESREGELVTVEERGGEKSYLLTLDEDSRSLLASIDKRLESIQTILSLLVGGS